MSGALERIGNSDSFIENHRHLPSDIYLYSILDYDMTTGKLIWIDDYDGEYGPRENPYYNKFHIGCTAGTVGAKGYVTVNINGEHYLAHRLIWKMMTGEDPMNHQINHKNGVKHDNRWLNLELVTRKQNVRHSFEELERKR